MVDRRSTRQKKSLQAELDRIDTFFTAEELHKRAMKKDNQVGIATIYRFLNELKKEGRLYSYLCGRRTVYSKENRSHCHFVCERTGKIIHFDIDSLDFLKDKIPGDIKSFQLEVRGYCKDCRPSRI